MNITTQKPKISDADIENLKAKLREEANALREKADKALHDLIAGT